MIKNVLIIFATVSLSVALTGIVYLCIGNEAGKVLLITGGCVGLVGLLVFGIAKLKGKLE